MNTPSRLAGFTAVVVAVFGAAAGIGAAVGPLDEPAEEMAEHAMDDDESGHDAGAHGSGETSAAAEVPGGLMVSQDGYTLDLSDPRPAGSDAAPLRFRIIGPDGSPVTEYTEEHGKRLHLIVVRRDLTDYQHVHPTLDDTGTWSVPADLSEAGDYRVFADFVPRGGEGLTLGADLSVPGEYEPRPLPAPTRTATVGDYTVDLDGTLVPGEQSKLTLSVSKDGRPVTDLQPYLEAYGHLVALRDGDLAYLHVHPDGAPGDGSTEPGPGITFYAETPSTGAYRLFLDFRHQGVVRTAEFTAVAGAHDAAPAGQTHDTESEHGH